jgi:hypothetical protein
MYVEIIKMQGNCRQSQCHANEIKILREERVTFLPLEKYKEKETHDSVTLSVLTTCCQLKETKRKDLWDHQESPLSWFI